MKRLKKLSNYFKVAEGEYVEGGKGPKQVYYLLPAPDAERHDKLDDAKDAVIAAYRKIAFAYFDFSQDFGPGDCGIENVAGVNEALDQLRKALANLEAITNETN